MIALLLTVALSGVCGDFNGDGRTTATDTLKHAQATVGAGTLACGDCKHECISCIGLPKIRCGCVGFITCDDPPQCTVTCDDTTCTPVCEED